MKLFKTILIFLFASVAIECDKGYPTSKETTFSLSSNFREQTVWEGTLTEHLILDEKPSVITSPINLFSKLLPMLLFK